jgi:hypothetical protein
MLIFVFGSNLTGRHGAGAALHARKWWDAELGVGRGRTGRAYALPTKDEKLHTLPVAAIEENINDFVAYARSNTDDTFILTPVGCGLAGLGIKTLIGLLKKAKPLPTNIVLSHSWLDHL